MFERLLEELRKPISKDNYRYLFIMAFITGLIVPVLAQTIFLAIFIALFLQIFTIFITAQRLSAIEVHIIFSLITLVPVLGAIFCIYLCIVDKDDFHKNLKKLTTVDNIQPS